MSQTVGQLTSAAEELIELETPDQEKNSASESGTWHGNLQIASPTH